MDKHVDDHYHSDKRKYLHFAAALMFIVYFSYLLYRLFFFAYGDYFRVASNGIRYNIIPFKTIISYLVGVNKFGFDVWFFNLFGNILAFMPMGFLLPYIFKKIDVRKIFVLTFSISLTVEIIQLCLKLGISDIDDVILNTLGGLLGYCLLTIFGQKKDNK
ncbi:VanZ family protein [Desulfosporosinus sp. OT]|uniref:VanZ family protein n=1 Tax=Desulfosporosinus sp. OT TaxID=913865 RepID=UPI000223A04C|nr:VanZ family protein [Desulfosporosinus sp. OT]EGW37270.1 vanZ like family protein [Desulfosporosinus sp. OT]